MAKKNRENVVRTNGLAIGDVVVLKGDSYKHAMTVNRFTEYGTECVYFVNDMMQRVHVAADALSKF